MALVLYLFVAYYVDVMRRHCELSGVRKHTGICLNVLGKIRKQYIDVPIICTGYLKKYSGTLKVCYCYNKMIQMQCSVFRNV